MVASHTVLTGCSPPLQNLYESIKNEPFKIPEDDGNDLTHTFFNPDREGWLLKLGEPGGGPALHPCPQQQLLVLLLWSHSPQLQGRKIRKKSTVNQSPLWAATPPALVALSLSCGLPEPVTLAAMTARPVPETCRVSVHMDSGSPLPEKQVPFSPEPVCFPVPWRGCDSDEWFKCAFLLFSFCLWLPPFCSVTGCPCLSALGGRYPVASSLPSGSFSPHVGLCEALVCGCHSSGPFGFGLDWSSVMQA